MVMLETVQRLASYANGLYGNAIINGNFDIWQRGTSFSGDGYTADRWHIYDNGCTLSLSQQDFPAGNTDVPNNPEYYARTTTSGSSTTSAEANLSQKIEDVRVFSGQTISGSFWARGSTAGKMGIEFIQGFGSGGSSSVFGIGGQVVAITSSWTKIEFTADIPSISGKTIGTSNALILQLYFSAGSGLDARLNGNLGNQNIQIDIAQVQLNAGSEVLPYSPRHIEEELRLCQRYYRRIGNKRVYEKMATGLNTSTTNALMHLAHPVVMRIEPTFGYSGTSGHFWVYDGASSRNVTSFSADAITIETATFGAGSASLTAYRPVMLQNNNSTSYYLEFDSEL